MGYKDSNFYIMHQFKNLKKNNLINDGFSV